MPKCRVCNSVKEAGDFYPKQLRKCGTVGECADCTKARVRDNRQRRADYYREYDAERYQNAPRVRQRHRRYQATEAGRKSATRSRMKWQQENPEKRAAQIMVGNAVRDGRLEKSTKCEQCGAGDCRIEGHHRDYSKPLDVVWLCRSCHVAEHRLEEA